MRQTYCVPGSGQGASHAMVAARLKTNRDVKTTDLTYRRVLTRLKVQSVKEEVLAKVVGGE